MTERDYQARIVELARTLGYRALHIPNCRTRSGRWSNQQATDLPDLILIRPPRLLMVELKGSTTPITPGQIELLRLLSYCAGVETFVWRAGVDTLQEIADVLARKAAA